MEDMFKATKGPQQYLKAFSMIKLNDFMQHFDIWCDM